MSATSPSANGNAAGYSIHQHHSRQATLHTAIDRNAGLIPRSSVIYATRLGLHEKWVTPSHAVVRRPQFLTPSTNPYLGNKSQHKKLHRCAL